MKYRKLGKTGIKASILGFGAMRLPLNSQNPEDINLKETKLMLDYAVEHGINIFDTALVYHTTDRSKPGKSETTLGEVLNTGYHEKIHISTKMPSWNITSWEYFDKTLNLQLERLQTDQIELFYIHSIKDIYYQQIKDSGLYEFIDRALDDGRIKHPCFSTHGSLELLNQILDDYDKWKCVLTQLNYLDEQDNTGLEGVRTIHKKKIATMIMEPLRGGQLVQKQPRQIQELFDKSAKDYTPIEWAFNYLWDKSEVDCVLSGMNNLQQVKENIETADKYHDGMLDEADHQTLRQVRTEYDKLQNIPCTACNYCMPCPFGVNIPKCFREYNLDMIGDGSITSVQYKFHMHDDRKAHNCTGCNKCLTLCPQQINIPQQLQTVAEHFRE